MNTRPQKTHRPIVPHPSEFRPWVRACLECIGMSPAAMSRHLGPDHSALVDFLAKDGRSIDMTTAHVLTCEMSRIARRKSVTLPSIAGVLAYV